MADVDDIITTSEAAEILRVSTREVRRKAESGTLPAWQEDGVTRAEWRFLRTDVKEYQRAREAGEDRKADTRKEGSAVLPATAIIDAQDRATEAALTLAGRLGDLADLRETLAANTEAQADLTGAVRDLVTGLSEELAETRAQRDALQRERDQLAAQAEKLAEELERRKRSWWERLFAR